jgi:hypothetical protein
MEIYIKAPFLKPATERLCGKMVWENADEQVG